MLTPRFAAAFAAAAALLALLVSGLGVPLEAAPAAASARPAADRTPPLQSRYYSTRELDVKPGIMTRTQPEYPEAAARRFLAGKVRLQLFIDESGAVERVLTLHADSPRYFEEPAQRAFRAARFSPGLKNGKPVKVQMTIEVTFDSPPPPAPPGRR